MSRLLTDLLRTRIAGPVSGREAEQPTAPTKSKFELRNVSFWYSGKQALTDINLSIAERSVLALIGPSGSGKSTLLRLLNRMSDFAEGCRREGAITLEGHDIHGATIPVAELRRRVGIVFQKSNPFPKSIYENVAFGPRVLGLCDTDTLEGRIENCLRRAALWDEVKDRLHGSALELSSGQQQRLCIARVLATDPDVLLMDEPASALDPKSTAKIEDLIYELKQELSIVIVTHNMQQAARVSDRTAFLIDGRIIEVGPTEKLFTKPQFKQTEDYITGRFG